MLTYVTYSFKHAAVTEGYFWYNILYDIM